MCHEMEKHQTSRGNEFRSTEPSERYEMARALVIARSQVQNEQWESETFRRAMRRKKTEYMYQAGTLNVDEGEAREIWHSVVYEGIDNSPAERKRLGLI
jgi:hypothetical protein